MTALEGGQEEVKEQLILKRGYMSGGATSSPLKAARRTIEEKAQAIRRNMSAEQLSKKAKEVRDLFRLPMYIRILDRMYAAQNTPDAPHFE